MKKQFFRVKQLADQTFSRAGKTEVLSDDLQDAERKVEYIRTACQNTSKKLSSGVITLGQDPAAKEKRLKKYPEYLLALAMKENSDCDHECLLKNVLADLSKAEFELANESFDFEVNIEQKVVTPLSLIIENEVPIIMKHKRNLQKLILDMDSARQRHHTAMKHSTSTGTARIDSIKDELEDAELKVEQCRDTLASDMFTLISKEAELAQSIVLHAKLQKEYHKSVLSILDELIPKLESAINDSPSKPVYHYSLDEHLRVTDRKIAYPIELCVCALLELGMEEEGLFRIAGGTSKLRRMKLSFDACCLSLHTAREYGDPHVIAGSLKSYLRELPEPLMTFKLYNEWMAAAKVQTSNEARLNALWEVMQKLPTSNYENLRYLIKFFARLTLNKEKNKMSPQNLAIVIAPNLIWSPGEESNNMGMNMNMSMNMSMANLYSSIVDTLISNAEWFFPGDIDFYQTFQPEPRTETCQINGMTRSLGSISITQQDDMDYYGHTRSSSGDTNLIQLGDETGIKRTQSNSSLSDHSPPQGSPKPVARRKNKPAPVPPSNPPGSQPTPEKPPRPSVPPAVSTLPRLSKKHSAEDAKAVISKPIVDTATFITMEKQAKPISDHFSSQERLNPMRRSIDFDHTGVIHPTKSQENQNMKSFKNQDCENKTITKHEPEVFKFPNYEPDVMKTSKPMQKYDGENKPTRPQDPPSCLTKLPTKHDNDSNKLVTGNSQDGTNLDKPEGSHPPSTVHIPAVVNVGAGKVTVNAETHRPQPFLMSGSSTLDRKRTPKPTPVAAPRSFLGDRAPDSGANKTEGKDNCEGVALRRSSNEGAERANKPAVPERPTMLQRPASGGFKTPRNSAEMEALPDAERPSLERIHMYCVDKQQVSIIQVGGEKEKERERAVVVTTHTSNDSGDVHLPTSPSDPALASSTDLKSEKPERPPKPEHIVIQPTAAKVMSSHVRTLSDGNIMDARQPPSPGSPKLGPGGTRHVPRPQPPPPPPPVKPRSDSAPGESTDL